MIPLKTLLSFLPILATLSGTHGATAEEWRSRSVYQLLTDRFAPPGPNTQCNTADRSYCGGNYQSIISKLDYIQGMGFDAIWISPVSQNIEGRFLYGEPYHGFWTTDQTKLNPHFGTDSDLKALSSALHSRNMLLMVDMPLNHLASTSTDISNEALATAAGGTLLFKDTANYHKPCPIKYGNHTSEEICWMAMGGGGENDITLMDLATDTDAVRDTFYNWIGGWVQEFGVDGFRLDATKHMSKEFQSGFCQEAGVYCTGEVYGDNVDYMGEGGIDAVLGFGMMYGLTKVFAGGDKKTMPTLKNYVDQNTKYPDPSVVQTFLDNHDLPRFYSTNPDPASAQNAIVGNFLISGIPTIYYGLEQEMSFGSHDPDNRDALWKYNDYSTETGAYQLIKKLNEVRKGLSSTGGKGWHEMTAQVGQLTDSDITLERDSVIIVLTNRGGSGAGEWKIRTKTLKANDEVIDVLSCKKSTVGSDEQLTITWTKGEPFVFVPTERAAEAGLCGATPPTTSSASSESASASTSATQSPSITSVSDAIVTTSNEGATSTNTDNGTPSSTPQPIGTEPAQNSATAPTPTGDNTAPTDTNTPAPTDGSGSMTSGQGENQNDDLSPPPSQSGSNPSVSPPTPPGAGPTQSPGQEDGGSTNPDSQGSSPHEIGVGVGIQSSPNSSPNASGNPTSLPTPLNVNQNQNSTSSNSPSETLVTSPSTSGPSNQTNGLPEWLNNAPSDSSGNSGTVPSGPAGAGGGNTSDSGYSIRWNGIMAVVLPLAITVFVASI